MSGVIAVATGNAGEQILIALAGHKVAIIQRGAAKLGQQAIAAGLDVDLMSARDLNVIGNQGNWAHHLVHAAMSPA